ncbi:MAG: hypothetical protein ABR985_10210 [Methanotrichaceae archaeon]|jgi:hypothetical protein
MDFDLHPSFSIRSRSFNALIAPNEMFAKALNRNLNLQRFKVLYICGNYSSEPVGPQVPGPGDPPSLHGLSAHDHS